MPVWYDLNGSVVTIIAATIQKISYSEEDLYTKRSKNQKNDKKQRKKVA